MRRRPPPWLVALAVLYIARVGWASPPAFASEEAELAHWKAQMQRVSKKRVAQGHTNGLSDSADYVWPRVEEYIYDGPALALAPSLEVQINRAGNSPRLGAAVARFRAKLALGTVLPPRSGEPTLTNVEITVVAPNSRLTEVVDGEEVLGPGTNYTYTLRVRENTAAIRAESVYGAMHGLVTLAQLCRNGKLRHTSITVLDRVATRNMHHSVVLPTSPHFFAPAVVRQAIDTMEAHRMNVLFLHGSDHCRWSIESKVFPILTQQNGGSALRGDGESRDFYTQKDIRSLVEYAAARGIRVIPEFDVPGHARGLLPLANQLPNRRDLKFHNVTCSHQMHDDHEGQNYEVLYSLLGEMAGLFPDRAFNLGCSNHLREASVRYNNKTPHRPGKLLLRKESKAHARCHSASTQTLERRLEAAMADFEKWPGSDQWEEAMVIRKAGKTVVVDNGNGGQQHAHLDFHEAHTNGEQGRIVEGDQAVAPFYFKKVTRLLSRPQCRHGLDHDKLCDLTIEPLFQI